MSIKNYIFQIQNAIFQVLKNSDLQIDIIMNRGQNVMYPYIMIGNTNKQILPNNQKELTTDLHVITKDLSVISAANILSNIEDIITQNALQEAINYYAIHFASTMNSTVFATEEGFFYGKISVLCILDEV